MAKLVLDLDLENANNTRVYVDGRLIKVISSICLTVTANRTHVTIIQDVDNKPNSYIIATFLNGVMVSQTAPGLRYSDGSLITNE